VCSRRRPRFVQKATQLITDPVRSLLFGHEMSAQHYSHADISPHFWVNGRPPKEEYFLAMVRENFANYSLEIGGLVERQLHLTLADLRAMPKQTQITKHCCIQGWSGVAEFWVNGRPPKEEYFLAMVRENFANYSLEIGGLVERQLHLTLADLRAMPKQTQITKHCCIQGWSGVAEWGGVSLHHIVGLCHPLPSARYIVFYAFDNKSTSEPHAQGPGYFYGTIRLELAEDPQTILAYEMNGQPLPILHGAPLRLRVETQLGFTMVKYIRAIEFIECYKTIGLGQGGWREDYQYFSQEAGI
jgi:DMSO/TMAO reductase YedYZ molybdopterin-dependent catalytic subunit